MFDFDIDFDKKISTVKKDTMISGVEETEDVFLKMYVKKIYQTIEKIKELKLPRKEEQLRLITKRTFNAVAFLKFITETEIIEDMVLVIYSINYNAAKVINDLIKTRKIKKATILISNLRNTAHTTKEKAVKDFFINNPNVELIYASSHAKIMTFKTDKENYYTIEGSGNLSFNSRIEQYIIDNCKGIYDFHKKWMKDIERYLKGKKDFVKMR